MLTFKSLMRGGGILAAGGLAAALLMSTVEPSSAGIFSWMKGPQANQGSDDGYGGPGLFGGGLFGGRPHGPQEPGSQAFHGDELPPEEGDAATRAWILNPALGTPTIAKANVAATQAAIAKYRAIVANGGWPMVPAQAMHPGDTGPQIVMLHRRLEISGDLVGMSVPEEYDAAVVAAVRKFQARHGLPPTGVIDTRAMVESLNVPASIRLAQLEANLKRLQTLSSAAAPRYVMVNIPAAQVEAVESGQVVQRHAAVVGKPERPTPELSSKIQEIDFNPF
jgi:peptidoglycan hydrolase-like protein with peptidoglycan-binding domain